MKRIESVTTPGGWIVTGSAETLRRWREGERNRAQEEAPEPAAEETPNSSEAAPPDEPKSLLGRWQIHPLLRRRSSGDHSPEA